MKPTRRPILVLTITALFVLQGQVAMALSQCLGVSIECPTCKAHAEQEVSRADDSTVPMSCCYGEPVPTDSPNQDTPDDTDKPMTCDTGSCCCISTPPVVLIMPTLTPQTDEVTVATVKPIHRLVDADRDTPSPPPRG